MPTFNDPVADAEESREALRGLAHATIRIENPDDIYAALGSLLAGARSLHQVLQQLSRYHHTHQHLAATDSGDHDDGVAHALVTAAALAEAAASADQLESHLDAALQHSGRIAWQPEPPTPAVHAQTHAIGEHGTQLDPSQFGIAPTARPRGLSL